MKTFVKTSVKDHENLNVGNSIHSILDDIISKRTHVVLHILRDDGDISLYPIKKEYILAITLELTSI